MARVPSVNSSSASFAPAMSRNTAKNRSFTRIGRGYTASTMAFNGGMTVAEVLEQHPHARWVFAAWQIRGCAGCDARHDETLAEVAEGYKLPLERLLADLNGLVECKG